MPVDWKMVGGYVKVSDSRPLLRAPPARFADGRRAVACTLAQIIEQFLVGFFPRTPGFDFAGEVVAVGAACSRIKVGDKVFGMGSPIDRGAFAEYMAVGEGLVSIIPEGVSFGEAASIPLAGQTCYQSLVQFGGMKAGMKVSERERRRRLMLDSPRAAALLITASCAAG
jgi:hypothetical protein